MMALKQGGFRVAYQVDTLLFFLFLFLAFNFWRVNWRINLQGINHIICNSIKVITLYLV